MAGKHVAHLGGTTLQLEDALHTQDKVHHLPLGTALWAPPSGHLPRRSHLLLVSSLRWMDCTQCIEEGREFLLILTAIEKNSNCHHFLKSLITFSLQKGFL